MPLFSTTALQHTRRRPGAKPFRPLAPPWRASRSRCSPGRSAGRPAAGRDGRVRKMTISRSSTTRAVRHPDARRAARPATRLHHEAQTVAQNQCGNGDRRAGARDNGSTRGHGQAAAAVSWRRALAAPSGDFPGPLGSDLPLFRFTAPPAPRAARRRPRHDDTRRPRRRRRTPRPPERPGRRMWSRGDSNPIPLVCKTSALPGELRPLGQRSQRTGERGWSRTGFRQ